jgi:hypothetical protein
MNRYQLLQLAGLIAAAAIVTGTFWLWLVLWFAQ